VPASVIATHRRIFRGWYVVAALFLGGFALYGAGLYSFILFVTPLSNEFHWSRAATGGLVSAFWLSAPLSLFADPLIRRFGVRRLAATGIVVEGLCLIFLFTATHLWQMYLLRAIAGLGKVLYAITLPVILAKWFSRRFGSAVAFMYSGWHVGGLALAPLAERLIHLAGWRGASVGLGIGLLVIALPPTLWALRVPSAAAIGQDFDGDPLRESSTTAPSHSLQQMAVPPNYAAALSELLRNPAFRMIAVGTIFYFLSYGGVLAHQAAVVEGSGIASSTASYVLGATAGFAALGALFHGWLIDKFSLTLTTAIQYGLLVAGIVALLTVTSVPSLVFLIAHSVCYGLGIGGAEVYWVTLLKRRIAAASFQRAWGVYYFLELTFIVIGPICAGLLYDLSGNYVTALVTEAVILAIPIALSLALARSGSEKSNLQLESGGTGGDR
jgi:MFS family permease